jgi:hypothetical protein
MAVLFRSISRDLFGDADVLTLSPLARWLFLACSLEADREGRFEWRPQTLKLRYLPADDCNIHELCDELLSSKQVVIYEVDGVTYAVLPTFTRLQNINPKERQSIIPPPPSDLHKPSQVKEAPVKKRTPSKTSLPENFSISERVKTWAASKGHDHLDERLEDFVGKARAKGYIYSDWDQAFMNAIRDDWAGLKGKPATAEAAPQFQKTSFGWEKRASDGTWFAVSAEEVPAELREVS